MSNFGICLLVLWQISLPSSRAWGQCIPNSATLYGAADHIMDVWINGNGPIGPVDFVTAPGTLPTLNIPVSYFNSVGTNIIAVENINTSVSEVLASWVIDVTCTSGQHAYFSNTDSGYTMYDNTTGSAPPTVDGSGNPWYSPSYSAAVSSQYFNQQPVTVTGNDDPWLQPMYNPETGLIQPYTSYNTTGSTSNTNQVLYYLGSFELNPVPYIPLTFSVSKIPGFVSPPIPSPIALVPNPIPSWFVIAGTRQYSGHSLGSDIWYYFGRL